MEPGVQRVAGLQHAVPGPRDGEKAFFSFFVFFERTRNSLFFVSLRKKKKQSRLAPHRPTLSASSFGRTTTSTR